MYRTQKAIQSLLIVLISILPIEKAFSFSLYDCLNLNTEDCHELASAVGFPSLPTMKQAFKVKNSTALAEATYSQNEIFWRLLHIEKTDHMQESVLRLWGSNLIKSSCRTSTSTEKHCTAIVAGLMSYYLFDHKHRKTFIQSLTSSEARNAMTYMHPAFFSIPLNSSVYKARMEHISNQLSLSQNSKTNAKDNHLALFHRNNHSREVLNFIWFGPDFPTRYANNLLDWADHYPDLKIVLWIDHQLISHSERTAFNALEGMRPLLMIRDIHDADFNKIPETALPVQNFLNNMLTIEAGDYSRILYAAASDVARIALMCRGYKSLPPEPGEQTYAMIYMDLDLTVEDTGGYLPLDSQNGDIFLHFYSNGSHLNNADLIAAKTANHPLTLFLLDNLTTYQHKELSHGNLAAIGFDKWYKHIRNHPDIARFPMLWDSWNSDYSWGQTDNPIFHHLWRDEFLKHTTH